MKRSLIVFIVTGLVLMTTGLWFFTSFENFNKMDLLHIGLITLIVGFAVFVGLKRLRSEKLGEPIEDELSKKFFKKQLQYRITFLFTSGYF